ncbi:pleiotropic drug resistance ABC transporter [Crucibulum laeve]|uniref:Pleiotropic drug resistance ABC transporter n=1 Tax=Crucibulum laeve TaxID=68775 RepID=A0A5C3M9A3_9AGAR|nr:pleiotropic drug resistance ABC transporter [Crucibulum laeve]
MANFNGTLPLLPLDNASWTSPRTRELLATSLPCGFILLAFFHDIATTIRHPKPVRILYSRISSPFRNFLTLEDLDDPVDGTLRYDISKLRALACLACISSIVWAGCFTFAFYTEAPKQFIGSLVFSIAWAYVALQIIIKPPSTPPYLFILFASFSVLSLFVEFWFDLVDVHKSTLDVVLDVLAMLLPSVFIWVAGTLPVQSMRPSVNIAQRHDIPSAKLSCPEDDVTFWSWCGFTFVEPILRLATSRTLNETDVWSLSPFFRHKNIFNRRLAYQTQHPTHSLLRFLLVSNSLDLILDVALEMWSAIVGFVPPYALKEILAALSTNSPEALNTAYFWALMTFLAHLSFAQVDLFQSWHTRRCYERTRGQLFCSLHYKSLKRQEHSGKVTHKGNKSSADLGKIVNLMQGDTYAVAQRFWEFSGIFTSPVRLAIALVFLYQVLGWSALSGVAVILLAYIFNYPLAKYNISITRSSWKAKDIRMGLVNELLQNIRFLKFFGWEYHWARQGQQSRETELKWRIKENVVDTVISFIWIWMPSATALTAFLCYTLIAGQRLTVSKAFTSIALFSQLQGPMTALPGQFFAMLHAYVSMQRIEEFLQEDDVPDWASTLTSLPLQPSTSVVGFTAGVFTWDSKVQECSSRFQLGPLDITFPSGKLTLVSGATGSGKSALLAALLGEMQHVSGHVMINKSNHQVAYCGQNPWLEHATIRDNIVFSSSFGFDEGRYQSVLDACALLPDLEIFDAGDMTEIGEKGITLSGGQRARIALARAMYSQAKCILLDDPLAAVDMHTAQHLAARCLSGELARDRTIILVTHHITLCLPVASYLVELKDGRVLRQGSIADLNSGGDLDIVIQNEDEHIHAPEQNTGDKQARVSPPRLLRQPSDGKLIEAETRAEGRVPIKTYLIYIRAAGLFSWVLTIMIMLLIRFIEIGNQVFLARWGEAYQDGYPAMWTIVTKLANLPWDRLPSPNVDVKPWLMIYFYISMTGALTTLLYIALGYYASLQASRSLFTELLCRLTRAPSRFFDVTPIGRILNRFTTDINTIDGALQNSARNCLSGILNFLASFTVILVVVPTFAPFALAIAWLYIRLAPPYIAASRDLRRLESVSLSPAFAGFDELLRGIAHIRAFGMENRYQNQFYDRVDKFQSFDHVYWLVNGWLRWRYDCLGSVVVFAATVFALWKGVTDGSTAIVIVQAGIFAEASRQLVRVAAQLELDFNSVERVVEYFDVPQEAPAIIEGSRPPAYWPSSSGELSVENLVVRYASHLGPALRGLSFTVRPSEKVGVVGRTGSGKSTLALSLLRMVEPAEGKIVIDGIDISTIGLEDLRTRVTIISQDVSLFSGTIRSNLDPLQERSTEECLEAMKRCHLTSILKHTPTDEEPTPLDMRVNQGSLSAGEKQLVALARAILRKTNIIILDEATSQIDELLDDQIQKTIREELSGAIVITIAHRLKTVMDYDRILVLDNGEIAEFAEPRVLLRRSGGSFREMCQRSADWSLFLSMLKEA